ncbi:Phosphatidylethanolamine-binding protein PEBP [Macrophomina phaseolina MS6]|uniref:Phosphatidylethanolamine-binding protein PEBP n=1 Tax=Macrophomina phaseolina (strain MS6) TaxID=1126212 RepID=K2T080_MACPH|nr:Phosphatidylethanolamine-binding protein PEBP [Macrophomina phaseolina MS6]
MFAAARRKLSTGAAARVLPAAAAPKRALSSSSPLVILFLSFVLIQLFLACADAHVLPADQQVMDNAAATPKSILRVRAELHKAEIIPTVVDDFLPTLTLDITWPSNETADLGNTLEPDDLQKAPSIRLDDEPTSASTNGPCKSNMTYVVAVTDPDAPSRDNPEWSEFCHWIISGVPLSGPDAACTSPDGMQNAGQIQAATQTAANGLKEVMEYYPPGPPPKTGKHRYVFLAFAPANSTSLPLSPTKPKERKHWGTGKERHGVRQWAEENGLVPVAANFIYAKNKKQ